MEEGEKEWVIKMVGEQFYLYTIKVLMIMIMIVMITMITKMMITTLIMISVQVECEGGIVGSYEVAIRRGSQDSTLAAVFQRVRLSLSLSLSFRG